MGIFDNYFIRCTSLLTFFVFLPISYILVEAANLPPASITPEVPTDVSVNCNSDKIEVKINTRSGRFNGMIYPRGLSKNSSCMEEWVQRPAPIRYILPLRGCNTMSTELSDGGIEYFNTIVVQPHLKLVTNQGRGFHIRCRYKPRNNTVLNDSLKVNLMDPDPLFVSAPMPTCSMRIYSNPDKHKVAENVKIGDPLTLDITLDPQDIYGLWVTDCLVRDGLGWGEQKLINEDGCPLDPEIMGLFEYSNNQAKATVKFQAHKFPYTPSVYYQCNVKLCRKADGGCNVTPPNCSPNSNNNRLRRQAHDLSEGTPATIEVSSGLYVNEVDDLARPEEDSVYSEKTNENICVSQRTFAIAICVAGLILMVCVVFATICLMERRRPKTTSNLGSSIYSGPYTNTAYSHSS